MDILNQLAEEFSLADWQVEKTVDMLKAGNTIPFIARYRKDETGGMEDQLLRSFSERLQYLEQLAEKRSDVARLIEDQGHLTEMLATKIKEAETTTALDDLYRPFRPKRKTRATDAIERGLTPLADAMESEGTTRQNCDALAEELASASEDLADREAAYAGASDILAERLSDDAEVRQALRNHMVRHGVLVSRPGEKPNPLYALYEEGREIMSAMPAHRILAVNRGEREEALKVTLEIDDERIISVLHRRLCSPTHAHSERLKATAEDSWKRLLKPSLIKETRKHHTEMAEDTSIELFKENLRDLLLAPPVPGHRVMGFDPGYRNGCKLAVIDDLGNVRHTVVIYPGQGKNKEAQAERVFVDVVRSYQVSLVAIGNGTASRESERFVARLAEAHKLTCAWLIVSEAGASVYSASPIAAEEFPDMDVALRSAVSIARRVQDPLAELVKIDPCAIGVGQYQHDMNQKKLGQALAAVVEDCVNHVGVDVNTASAPLLSQIAGISDRVAKEIVAHRQEKGAFQSRKELLKVPKLGPKTFEQAAGFLRIAGGKEPLDNTSVHPESYGVVRALADNFTVKPSPELVKAVAGADMHQLAEQLSVGPATLQDILDALEKPGRDPREAFAPPALRHDLMDIKDLEIGMELDGVVRNLTAFGAFVDIGLHEDGLVHVSEMADRFVKDPHTVVRIGENVRVRVISVDVDRSRIGLSMKQTQH